MLFILWNLPQGDIVCHTIQLRVPNKRPRKEDY